MAQLYSLVPLPQGPFAGLDPVARLVFGLIYDRHKISRYNVLGTAGDSPWIDSAGEIFCIFTHDELAALTGCSERTIRRSLDALRDAHILRWEKARFRGCNHYYVEQRIIDYLKPATKRSN